jgi:hypothetical protein
LLPLVDCARAVSQCVLYMCINQKVANECPKNDTPPASVHGYCFDFISDGSPTGPSSDGLYSSQVRYAVSNTQQGHIFRSPAKYSTGSVNLTVSSEYGESIGISVTAMHKSLEVLRRISICTSRPPEGKSQSSIHVRYKLLSSMNHHSFLRRLLLSALKIP